jgi:hypothetical protein
MRFQPNNGLGPFCFKMSDQSIQQIVNGELLLLRSYKPTSVDLLEPLLQEPSCVTLDNSVRRINVLAEKSGRAGGPPRLNSPASSKLSW